MSGITEFDRLRIVLVNSRNPLNIGAAARAMSNFGFTKLRVVNPYAPAYREARSAVGASEVLANAETFAHVAEAVADCTLVVGTTAVGNRKLQQQVHGTEQGGLLIRKALHAGRVSVLFGSERVGLSNQEMSHCHWLMRIPTRKEHISMNLGQAVAICLYELARTGNAPSSRERLLTAPAGDLERVSEILMDALRKSGYPGPPASNEMKVRRLVRRMRLSAEDSEIWLGILRQILWKINKE
jgi:TrmH family RNA methyltransferase